MIRVHTITGFRRFHLAYWLVAGVALFISGYSQSNAAVSGVRNAYLALAGAGLSYLLLAGWQRLRNQKFRRSWFLFLTAAYGLGMLIVIPVNPVTFGQLGVAFEDLTQRHVFAGIMNFGFVMMFWGVCLMFLFRTEFHLPGMGQKSQLDQPGMLEVETRDGTASVPLKEITHLKAAADYVEVHTLDKKTYLKRATVKSLIGLLDKQGFVQVHRSLVFNSAALKTIEGQSKGAYTLVMANGVRLKTSRRFKAAVEALLP